MRLRAFVFDDDSQIRSLLWTLLDRRGYEVFTFPDPGLCPLYLLHECQCSDGQACTDIIISDMNMPDVKGLDFVEAQMEKGCKCRNIALMSGDWSESDLLRAKSIGCRVFFKPFLIEPVDQWLDEVEKTTDPERKLADWFWIKDSGQQNGGTER